MPESPIKISSWPIHQDIGSETRDREPPQIRAWQTLRGSWPKKHSHATGTDRRGLVVLAISETLSTVCSRLELRPRPYLRNFWSEAPGEAWAWAWAWATEYMTTASLGVENIWPGTTQGTWLIAFGAEFDFFVAQIAMCRPRGRGAGDFLARVITMPAMDPTRLSFTIRFYSEMHLIWNFKFKPGLGW